MGIFIKEGERGEENRSDQGIPDLLYFCIFTFLMIFGDSPLNLFIFTIGLFGIFFLRIIYFSILKVFHIGTLCEVILFQIKPKS